MRNKFVLLAIAGLFIFGSRASAQNIAKSTIDDQQSVEVTVYNNNLGLIKDTRKVTLPVGEGELRFMDVASRINPVTVHVKSMNFPNDFTVLEQNYEYDLITPEKLLDKFVGKKLKLVGINEYKDRKEVVEAELLSNNNRQPIFKIDNEIYIGQMGLNNIVLPEIPENLIAQPTLTWVYKNKSRRSHELEVSYLTNNITWKADYVVTINKDDTNADVSGWVTIDNKSGTIYRDAKLKLVAGEVQRVQEQRDKVMYELASTNGSARASGFQEKAFFEYHIYDLQRPTTIKNNQTKQISLLEANDVKIKKELLVYGQSSYYTRLYRETNPKQPVNVYIEFKNSKDNNMGMPLPKGIMRLYKKDSKGKLQFIGEDRIEHTPKDEKVKLKLGEAFDVVCERRQTDYRQVTTSLYETAWEITLRNHKDEDVTVGVIEPIRGNWTMVSNSHPFTKMDAFTVRFNVPIKKNGEVKITYRVRVGL